MEVVSKPAKINIEVSSNSSSGVKKALVDGDSFFIGDIREEIKCFGRLDERNSSC